MPRNVDEPFPLFSQTPVSRSSGDAPAQTVLNHEVWRPLILVERKLVKTCHATYRFYPVLQPIYTTLVDWLIRVRFSEKLVKPIVNRTFKATHG